MFNGKLSFALKTVSRRYWHHWTMCTLDIWVFCRMKLPARNIWENFVVSCSKPLLLLEIPTVISDAAHEIAIFSLSSDPFLYSYRGQKPQSLQKCIKEGWNTTIPSALSREDENKSQQKSTTGVGAWQRSGEKHSLLLTAICSLTDGRSPRSSTCPTQHFKQQRCVPRHSEWCACAAGDPHKGMLYQKAQGWADIPSVCTHSASCRCPDVWWGFSATGTPLCSRFLSACDPMKTNSAQFNIIFDTALRSLGGRDWYQMLWYGFLKDRLH